MLSEPLLGPYPGICDGPSKQLMQLLPETSTRELRDAARLALQSAVAAAGMFLTMQAFGLTETFVGVLSAVLVIQPSMGSTVGEARQRFVSTLVGSLLGFVCVITLPTGAISTAAALAVSMLVVNGVAGLRPQWRYGVVAAVALSLGSDENLVQTALDRAMAIGLGAVLGVVVSLVVWPDTAAKRAHRFLASALEAAAERLSTAVRGAAGGDLSEGDEIASRFHTNLQQAKEAAADIRFGDAGAVGQRLERTSHLYNSVLILNRVAEETDSVASSFEGFDEALDKIRQCGCEIVRGLADGEVSQEQRMSTIRDAISELRSAESDRGEEDDNDHAILRPALLFGLDEVEDSLSGLLEAYATD